MAAAIALLCASLSGCGRGEKQKGEPAAGPSTAELRVRALEAAADRRDTKGFGEADVSHPDPAVRRAAARGISRLRDSSAASSTLPFLLRLLADRDAETTAYAAYGLGGVCAGNETQVVAALVARSATFLPLPLAEPASPVLSSTPSPAFALARALGQCGSEAAEIALRGWLGSASPAAGYAALGLGDIAAKRKLLDESIIALLAAAERGRGDALFPFSRSTLEGASTVRVREVAEAALGAPGPSRVLAVRALGRTDAAAATALSGVLARKHEETDVERAEAARALGRLGPEGQRALLAALPALLPGKSAVGLTALVADPFGPLLTILDELRPPVAGTALDELVALSVAEGTPPAVALRIGKLRCAAAAVRADADVDDAKLVACDVAPQGDLGVLARLSVAARGPLGEAKRRALVAAAASSPSARVRARAFELVGAHAELEGSLALLLAGLAHEHGGTVSAAADALAKRRDLLHAEGPPRAELIKAVGTALARVFPPDETEVTLSLFELAALVKDASFLPALSKGCASPASAVRQKARRGLTLLAKEDLAKACDLPLEAASKELGGAPRGTVVLVTDAGELALHIDGREAPVAAARFLTLAREGFFKNMAVHRVVPGFVVQWGDRLGDGTGGANRDPLRCETAPLPFAAMTVGVALAGRDTGSSQFFVTLSRVPHLDGAYTAIGRALGDWAAVTEGDLIHEVRVTP